VIVERDRSLTFPTAAGAAEPPPVPTVRLTHVTGVDDIVTPDPTEDYHEASSMYPGVIDPLVQGGARLERSAELRITATRSVKRHPGRDVVSLPPPDLRGITLADALAVRRSVRRYGDRGLALVDLATLLHSAYGVTERTPGTAQWLRVAPSGGALYPLELYVACSRVRDAEPALYHYDPLRHCLERLRLLTGKDELGPLTPYPELLAPSAAVVLVTAVFWRSRFKYGARAYRFTLIEAGHAAQGLLLAAAALGLATVPLGGFYDRLVDAFLGIDGLHEAALYLLPVGGSPQ
jgi:SagB-type dehydrogenase family enzyme